MSVQKSPANRFNGVYARLGGRQKNSNADSGVSNPATGTLVPDLLKATEA